MKQYRVLCVNKWVSTGFMLALLILATVNLANLHSANAALTAPPGVKDGAYMWYKLLDFNTNTTDYTYVEFVEVHEDTAEMVIRTALPNLNQSEWTRRPPSYGYFDFESGDLTVVGATEGVGLSLWANPSLHLNTTSGFPPDNQGYGQVDCFVVESGQERSWYDKVTGLLVETIFLSGGVNTRIATLYQTNIPVGRAASQLAVPVEISANAMTYAIVLIGLVAAVAIAAIGIRRFRRRKRPAQAVLTQALVARQCPSCGHKNREDAIFCARCGGPLATPRAPAIKPEPLVTAAPPIRPQPSVPVAPVTKAEPPVTAVTPPREFVRRIPSPAETRNVCRTCGHVNPDWVTLYCVRCAAKLQGD